MAGTLDSVSRNDLATDCAAASSMALAGSSLMSTRRTYSGGATGLSASAAFRFSTIGLADSSPLLMALATPVGGVSHTSMVIGGAAIPAVVAWSSCDAPMAAIPLLVKLLVLVRDSRYPVNRKVGRDGGISTHDFCNPIAAF